MAKIKKRVSAYDRLVRVAETPAATERLYKAMYPASKSVYRGLTHHVRKKKQKVDDKEALVEVKARIGCSVRRNCEREKSL